MKKHVALLCMVLILTTAMTLFAGGQSDAKSTTSDVSEVIVAIGGADPADLAPFVGMSYGRIQMLHTMYEYLFDLEEPGKPLVPYIAKSYEKKLQKEHTKSHSLITLLIVREIILLQKMLHGHIRRQWIWAI